VSGEGYVYRACWPILDDDRHLSELVAEASELLGDMVYRAGAILLAAPAWRVDGDRLFAEAPARPLAARPQGYAHWGSVSAQVDRIRFMATARRMTDRQIADELASEGVRCSESAVLKVRQRAKPPIPPGVGNPTLRGASHG